MKKTTMLAAVMMMLLLQSVQAIGVSPPRIIADSLTRGSHTEYIVVLSGLNGGETVNVRFEGPAGEWISVDKGKSFVFPKNLESLPLVFSINVPQNAANGIYESKILVNAAGESSLQESSGAEASVIAGVVIAVSLKVTGEQVSSYEIKEVAIEDAEEGEPISVIFTIKNTGNVASGPDALSLRVKDRFDAIVIDSTFTGITGARPQTTEKSLLEIDNPLGVGQYWTETKVIDSGAVVYENTDQFDILKSGSFSISGELESLEIPEEANIGDLLRIDGTFSNSGGRSVRAALLTEVYSGSRLVKTIKSEPLVVEPGKKGSLVAYLKPETSGDYIIKGVAVFADRQTDPRTARFVIKGGGLSKGAFLILGALSLLAVAISVFAVILFRRFK